MSRLITIAAALPFLVTPALADNPEVLASGLVIPVGLDTDAEGRIWISEIGPPANAANGSLSYFAPATGWTKQAYITGLPTVINPNNGEPSGSHCISFSDGIRGWAASFRARWIAQRRHAAASPALTKDLFTRLLRRSSANFARGFPAVASDVVNRSSSPS